MVIGQRPGSANYDLAVSHGFEPVSLAKQPNRVTWSTSYTSSGDIYRDQIRDNLSEGNIDVLARIHPL